MVMNRKSKDVTLGITVPNSNWKIAEAEITSMHLAHISVVLTLPACYTHICGAHSPSLLHTYLRCSLSQLVTHTSMKSGGVKLVLYAYTCTCLLSEMMQSCKRGVGNNIN